MRLSQLIMLLAAVFLLAVAAMLFYYYGYYLIDYQKVPIDLKIIKGGIGLTTDNDMLHFGNLNPGGLSRRRMNITAAEDSLLRIRISGDAASFVSVSENDILLDRGEQIQLKFFAEPPNTTALGPYEGVASFYFFRR